MKNKEEKMTLEEQRINEMLFESVDLSKYPGISPTYWPPEFEKGCITLEEFAEEGRRYLKQLFDERYGTTDN